MFPAALPHGRNNDRDTKLKKLRIVLLASGYEIQPCRNTEETKTELQHWERTRMEITMSKQEQEWHKDEKGKRTCCQKLMIPKRTDK